ncbi:hypothetical protein LTR94_008937 [Friedmanniomyces endolithicus]|nr:hypothetical protein LTR94_008937 [Friedmanniomyces endolithicus]
MDWVGGDSMTAQKRTLSGAGRLMALIGVNLLLLPGCSSPAPQPKQEEARPSAADLTRADADIGVKPVKTEPVAPIDAKAATSVWGGIVRISYKRPDDGKLFKNDCQLQGNRIMWRGVDISPGSGPGRWRNHPDDEILTFKIKGKSVELTTTYSDGSSATETQPLL